MEVAQFDTKDRPPLYLLNIRKDQVINLFLHLFVNEMLLVFVLPCP